MTGLRAFVLKHQPIVAPVVVIGMLALTAVGAQFLDDHHAPAWLKWVIGVPYVAFTGFVGVALASDDDEDDDDQHRLPPKGAPAPPSVLGVERMME